MREGSEDFFEDVGSDVAERKNHHWIGLRENLQETHGFLPSNWSGFPVNVPIIQFYETSDKLRKREKTHHFFNTLW